jgi:hypothetical protein
VLTSTTFSAARVNSLALCTGAVIAPEPHDRLARPTRVWMTKEGRALQAEGLDPDDPAVIAAIDLVRWELSLGDLVTAPARRESSSFLTRRWYKGNYRTSRCEFALARCHGLNGTCNMLTCNCSPSSSASTRNPQASNNSQLWPSFWEAGFVALICRVRLDRH